MYKLNIFVINPKFSKVSQNGAKVKWDFLMRGPWSSVPILRKIGPYLVPIYEKSGPFLVPFRDFFLQGPQLGTLFMQQWGSSAIFSILVHPIDLILHILNVLNGLHRWQRCIRLFKFLFLSLVFLVKCFGSIVICPTCLLSFFNFLHSFFFIHHSASPSSRLLVYVTCWLRW